MGCGVSKPETPTPVPADAGGGDLNGDEAGGEWRSRIFGPPGADASANPYPALVVVHGLTEEGIGWLKMEPLAEELAKLSFDIDVRNHQHPSKRFNAFNPKYLELSVSL